MADPKVTTTDELRAVLDQVRLDRYSTLDFEWDFEFRPVLVRATDDGTPFEKNGWLVWVSFRRPDIRTKEMGRGRGRDEIVWAGTTVSGVVKTTWLLVELMVRHELMEAFLFQGSRIFNPHNSVYALSRVQKDHEEQLGT
jgi:hypothetical protein